MVLKLDPRFPLVWRSPWDLQFGVDPVRVVLHDVNSAEERLIAALTAGISRSGLTMIAESAGASDTQVEAILRKVSPVLEHTGDLEASDDRGIQGNAARFVPSPLPLLRQPAEGTRVDLVGKGPTVERIARILSQSGIRVVVANTATATPGVSTPNGNSAPGDPPAIGVAVGHFVLDPDLYGYWLRRDIPHLPVIFGDSAVSVGPLVEPGTGPCLFCLERHRSDAEPLWPTLATQLWGRRSATETPLVSREVAATAARMVLMRLSAGVPGAAATVRLDAQTGVVSRRSETPHPECGCRGLPIEARPGIDSPAETVPGAYLRQPTSTRATGGRE